MRYLPLLLLWVLTLSMTSCGDTCAENQNALPLGGFYLAGDSTNQKIRVDSLSIAGIGAPGDSILSAATELKSEIYLPFRIDSDTTGYVFTRRAGGTTSESRVEFIYSRTPRFVSVECGVSYVFGIRKIECTGNLIDSIVCPAGYINSNNVENLRIYFSPNSLQR